MNRKQQLKLDVITKIEAGKINHKVAAKILGVSLRTVGRYLRSYRDNGIKFIFHGNAGRSPKNKYPDYFKDRVIEIVKDKYFDFNQTHIREKLSKIESIYISQGTLGRWLREERLTSTSKMRPRKIKHARHRSKETGVILQMDGSYHKWFGGKESCLITAIDDCNNEIYYGGFYQSESTLACMDVIKKIIEKKGLFDVLYVDRAGTYGGGKRQLFSNLQRACKELGILVMFANSPEGKGRIERLFRTLQDRLIPEMRLAKVKTKSQADAFFNNYIATDYKERFVIPYNGPTSFRPSCKNLEEVFCIKERRTVNRDHTFVKNKIRYEIKKTEYSMAKKEIEIRTYINGSIEYFFMGKKLEVQEFIDYLEAV